MSWFLDRVRTRLIPALITLAACSALKDYSRSDIADDATYARA